MTKSTTQRNLIIFSLVTISAGWIGAWLNTVIPSPSPQESLGLLTFLLLPFLAVFLLRGFGKDGWADFGLRLNLKGNMGWYALALLVFPAMIALTLLLGAFFGLVSFEGLANKGASALFSALAIGFSGSLIKNIAEEFAWRGYLTPRFQALGLGDLSNHLLTGLIWGLWHVPYWLFLLGPDLIGEYTGQSVLEFILWALIGIFPLAIVLGELRLKSGSLWPAFLTHTVLNAINPQLQFGGFIILKPQVERIFSPGNEGLVMMLLTLLVGVWILRKK
jgi:membrane protease YdiL (CAAX protease family)